MCDTMACITKNNRVFFGKNSDRNPLEPQMLTIERGDTEIHKHTIPLLLDKYVPQLLLLTQVHEKFDNPYTALLSRPAWMWGAEMGVNEHGLAIGNEAVFSRSKVDSKGLLGMDIVRLALHNAKTASQSVDLIVNLIETYGQGGDGAYKGSLRYHNSFLASDAQEAWILETAGKHWVAKRINAKDAISNAYSIQSEYDKADVETKGNFSATHASRLYAFITKGAIRRQCALEHLSESCNSWTEIRDILLLNKKPAGNLDTSMGSICMDCQLPSPSRTMSSMIVEYDGSSILAWCNASPLPVYSTYVPYCITKAALDNRIDSTVEQAFSVAKTVIERTEGLLASDAQTRTQTADRARLLETHFEQFVRPSYTAHDLESLDNISSSCRRAAEHDRSRQQFS